MTRVCLVFSSAWIILGVTLSNLSIEDFSQVIHRYRLYEPYVTMLLCIKASASNKTTNVLNIVFQDFTTSSTVSHGNLALHFKWFYTRNYY